MATLRTIFPVIVGTMLFASFAASSAQTVQLYGTLGFTHYGNVESGVNSKNQVQTVSTISPVVGGGATLNLLNVRVLKLGVDVRGSTNRSDSGGLDTALIGLRLGINPPLLRLKPYVEVAGGYLATRTVDAGPANGTITNQYGVYEILGGVDRPIAPFVDWRIVEVGGGRGIASGQYTPGLFTISTGLVLHF